MPQCRLRVQDYTVGLVCALPIELAAVTKMLDEEHHDLPRDDNDTNLYTLGHIGKHNVVIACLPAGLASQYGTGGEFGNSQYQDPRIQGREYFLEILRKHKGQTADLAVVIAGR